MLQDHFFKIVQEGVQSLLWGSPFGRLSGVTSIGAIESLVLLMSWVRWQSQRCGGGFSLLTSISTIATAWTLHANVSV